MEEDMLNVHRRGPWVECAVRVSCVAWTVFSVRTQCAHAQTLSLQEVLAHAEKHAPSILATRARLGLGDAAIEAAQPRLRDNPEFEVGIGPRTTVGADPVLDLKLRVQQRIPVGGLRGARIDAAHSLRAVESARLSAAKFAVRVNVRAAFYGLLLDHQRTESARQIEAVQSRVAEIAISRLQAGDIGPLGVRLAEADLGQAAQARIKAEGDEQLAQLRLAALAGLSVDAQASVVGELPTPASIADVSQLLYRARTQQPARRVALAELAEREQRMRVAARDTWTGPAVGLEFAHEDRNQNVALVTFSMALPVFDRNQGNRVQARAERDLTLAELDAVDQTLPLRIRAWSVAVDGAAKRIALYSREVLPRFKESLEMIESAFALGELDALAVSTARARVSEAQRTALDSYGDYFEGMANLQMETGTELPMGKEP
jgi:cobalt-zinc-cadmium efflux system outer membrane protein